MKTFTIHDIPVTMGQNKFENSEIVQKMEPDHTWFHLDGLPSAHITIPIDYDKISKSALYQIALSLKQNSKHKKQNNVTVIYTHRKSLKLTNTPGKVFIQGKSKTIKV